MTYDMNDCGPICGRCFKFVDSNELMKAPCRSPEEMKGLPIGMYHCPDCGAMVLAGEPHPKICGDCLTELKGEICED